MDEIYEKIFTPYVKEKGKPQYHMQEILNDENTNALSYLVMCFHESLRMEPPVIGSTSLMFTENVTLGEFKISKGTGMNIFFHNIHHNPKEWQQHDQFIPERFDPSSPYYLTPGGKKRNPYSFTPFLGGKRVCLGKTFAETIAKYVVPSIFGKYKFELKDHQKLLTNKPPINVDTVHYPQVEVKIKKHQKFMESFA